MPGLPGVREAGSATPARRVWSAHTPAGDRRTFDAADGRVQEWLALIAGANTAWRSGTGPPHDENRHPGRPRADNGRSETLRRA
jgi:hypothetical protein